MWVTFIFVFISGLWLNALKWTAVSKSTRSLSFRATDWPRCNRLYSIFFARPNPVETCDLSHIFQYALAIFFYNSAYFLRHKSPLNCVCAFAAFKPTCVRGIILHQNEAHRQLLQQKFPAINRCPYTSQHSQHNAHTILHQYDMNLIDWYVAMADPSQETISYIRMRLWTDFL